MAQAVYIILGYGIPQDIMHDVPYTMYLTQAFNKIYSHAEVEQIKEPYLILCGGATNYLPGHKTTEADEMKKWILDAMKRAKVSGWHVLTERESVSTVENVVFAKKLMAEQHIHTTELHIFCEQTRVWRVSQIVEAIFGGKGFEIHGVDFDRSARRYQGLEQLLHYERLACSYDIDALEHPEIMEEHHNVYSKKMELMRNAHEDEQQAIYDKWASEVFTMLEERYS